MTDQTSLTVLWTL